MNYFHLRVERPFHLREMIDIIRKEEGGLLRSYCGQLQETRLLCVTSNDVPAGQRLCESCNRAAARQAFDAHLSV